MPKALQCRGQLCPTTNCLSQNANQNNGKLTILYHSKGKLVAYGNHKQLEVYGNQGNIDN